MIFQNPFSLLFSVLLPIIVLMYILRLRRPSEIVSSTFLWQHLVRDVEANAPWQKLKNNILMYLQLLLLAALIFSVANPFIWAQGSGGTSMIIIIDTSASMAATDISPNRFGAAKQQALALVQSAPEDTRITIIAAGEKTEILVSASQDRRLTQQSISSIAEAVGQSDMSAALQISAAITSRQPNTDIFILSDGNVKVPERINIQGNVIFNPIGIEGQNLGITDIDLTKMSNGSSSSIFVQVENFGPEQTTRRLEIYIDGTLFDAIDLDLSPYSKESYVNDDLAFETQIVRASLANEDFYPTDDSAWAVASDSNPIEILLVTDGNRFIETALSLLPNITFSLVSTSSFTDIEKISADIVIFDGYSPPEENLPNSSMFFIAPDQSTNLFEVTGLVEQPKPRAVKDQDLILNNISFEGVSIFQANKIQLPTWANLSITGDFDTGTTPLLFYGNAEGNRIAVLAFKVQSSDLPVQVAFPLLIANLVNWLAPDNINSLGEPQRTILSQTVQIPDGVKNVTITYPDGTNYKQSIDASGILGFDSVQPGLYSISWNDNEHIIIPVNHFSETESQISPNNNLDIAGFGDTKQRNVAQVSKRILWRSAAIIALFLLLIEWFFYNRGTLSRITNSLIFRKIK